MSGTLIGIAVGTTIAIIGQLIALLFELAKRKESENRKAKAIIKIMLQELAIHQTLYEHHLLWVSESIAKDGEQHTGYSYQPATIEVYEKIFLPNWYVLPDKITEVISEYYSTIEPINILSGSFGSPTPVPIIQVKFFLENAQAKAREVKPLLDRRIHSKK